LAIGRVPPVVRALAVMNGFHVEGVGRTNGVPCCAPRVSGWAISISRIGRFLPEIADVGG
jgi:hypothetical protein